MSTTASLKLASHTTARLLPLRLSSFLLASGLAGAVYAQSPTSEDSAAAKAQYESMAAMYDAKSKMYQAEAAADKAKYGDIKPLFEGTVTAAEKAGDAEAQLLAVNAYKALAADVADRLVTAGATDVLLVTTAPDFGALVIFDARIAGFEQIKTGLPDPPPKLQLASVAGVLAGAQAVNALLGVVRTDFSVRGATVTGSEHAWTVALAGALRSHKVAVRMPAIYLPSVAEQTATDTLGVLLGWANETSDAIAAFEVKLQPIDKELKKLRDKLAATRNPAARKKLEVAIEAQETIRKPVAADRKLWSDFQTALSTFIAELTTPDKEGRIALADIVRQTVVRDLLGLTPGSPPSMVKLLHTRLDNTVGSTYTKKNLLTSLGGMPFYVMGGASASVTLFDAGGAVLHAESSPWHGGFLKASKVQDVVNKR